MTDPDQSGPRVERKVRQGVEYLRVTFPSFADGQPELVVNYWADGRVSMGSARIGLVLRRMHLHKTGCSVELLRTGLPEHDGPPVSGG